MISRQMLTELMSFHPDPYLTTTLYLPIDLSRRSGHIIELKDLVKQKKQQIKRTDLKTSVQESLEADFKKILSFVRLKFKRQGAKSLVIFSCSEKDLWQSFPLRMALPAQMVVQSRPHLRPLTMVLEDYNRFLVILLERSRARLFEAFAGEIAEQSSVLDDVPAKVRMGGFGGYEERRIERHIEDHVRRHFKHVSDRAYDLFRTHELDAVILLGTDHNTHEFKHYLPHALQEKLVATHPEDVNAPLKKVLDKVQTVEKELKQTRERRILDRLFNEVNSGGLGIVSLDSVVRALKQGQVNFLVVEEGFCKNGYRCMDCESLLTENHSCDYCGGKTKEVEDLVEQAVEEALVQGCQVKFVSIPDLRMSQAGHIGAVLRFRA